jgi:multiple sugar transport system substrate-binding protein
MTPSSTVTTLSRRTVLSGISALTAAAFLPRRAFAATPGSNVDKYGIDLGGYDGPKLTSSNITLKFMRQDFPPAVNALFDAAYAQFTSAYPNIKIEEERVPYGDLTKKVQIYVGSQSAPDLMMGRNDFASAYAAGQFAVPLQQFIADEFLADLYDGLRESATVGDNLVCLPWVTNPDFIFFNQDLFAAAGVATPPETDDVDAGWTVEEFIDALKRITASLRAKGNTDTFAYAASDAGNGGPGSNYTQVECVWVRMQGDPAADKASSLYKTFACVSDDGLKASGFLDTPEAISGMTNYQSLFKLGLTPAGAAPGQFVGGAAATAFANVNLSNRLKKASVPFKWGVTPTPRGKSNYPCSLLSDSPFVYSGSRHIPEAAALLAFLCNDANRLAFDSAWGSMPARKSLVDNDPSYKTEPAKRMAAATAAKAFAPPKSAGWFDYFNVANTAVKDIALGADPAVRLHDAAAQIDKLLAKYK